MLTIKIICQPLQFTIIIFYFSTQLHSIFFITYEIDFKIQNTATALILLIL